MEDDKRARLEAYIKEQLEGGYERKKVVAMLVHTFEMDVLVAQDTVAQVQDELAVLEQKRRKKVKVRLIIGGIFLAEAVVHTLIFGPVIAAGVSALIGVVFVGLALKNMR